ncbi:MAG: DMT family transporter [Deltaproteobacteria bacterium]|nr:DMT family transporter [Deltaproteobacteria bacterium]
MTPQFLALVTSFFYAGCFLATRRGLMYSTPATAAYVALAVNTTILSVIVFLTGGIPDIPLLATACFVVGGWLQLGTRLFAYHGVARLGASVTSTVQSTNPLFGTALAVLFLHETVTPLLLFGTGSVVLGIILLSWNPGQQTTYRTWELLFPVVAALTAGINHPIRRYGLTLANEPLFLSAVMGTSALAPLLLNLVNPRARQNIVFHRRAMPYFLVTGVFEAIGIWSLVAALGVGKVVVVGPIVCVAPLWVLLGTLLFSRDIEQVKLRTGVATLFVITGIIVIYLS